MIQVYENGLHPTQEVENIGQVSDGYHTFDELYAHRTALFRALLVTNIEIAWKSREHEVGGDPMYDGFFVAGLNMAVRKKTHGGGIEKIPITYHVENKYWDDFEVAEYPNAPKFDGHTPDDVIQRLLQW